jgi:DNA replication and repair protein RecF
MVQWGENSFSLRIESGEANPTNRVEISTQISQSGQKTIKINGENYHKMADLLGKINVILFCPDDIAIINGSPAVRRLFLDTQLCQLDKTYLSDLRKYNRVLRQRNTVLREPENFPGDILNILDSQIVEVGARVIGKRKSLIEEIQSNFQEYYRSIATDEMGVQIVYQPSPQLNFEEKVDIQDQFSDLLVHQRDRERMIQTTEIGPHRDNLLFLHSGKPAEKFGSQGQKRLIALCLKLAAADILTHVFMHPPVLLLDDIFAELDGKRRARLGEIIGCKGQVLAASPRVEDIPFEVSKIINVCSDFIKDDNSQKPAIKN